MPIQSVLNHFQGISLVAFFALSFVIPSGYNYGLVLLLVLSLILAFSYFRKEKLTTTEKAFFIGLVVYIVITVFVHAYHQDSTSKYDSVSKFTAALLLLYALSKKPVATNWYQLALILGSIAAFYVALMTRIKLHWDFPVGVGYQHHIEFSNMTMIMGTATFFLTLKRDCQKWQYALFFIAGLLGIAASILGGGRGGWLMLPFVAFIYLLAALKRFTGRQVTLGLLAVLILGCATVLVPQTKVQQHICQIIYNISDYQKGDVKTSQGQRLVMWQVGWQLIKEKPWLGWGSEGQYAEKKRLANAGVVTKAIIPFTHLHNDYIDRTSKFGVIGGAAVFFIYLLPLVLYIQHLLKRKWLKQPSAGDFYAWSGIAITIAFMVGSLSNTNFTHNVDVLYFLLFETLCVVGMSRKQNLSWFS